MLKVNWYQKIVQYAAFVAVKVTTYLVLHTRYFYVLNSKNLVNNSFILLMKFLLIFSLIVYRKSMNIPDDKEEDFDDSNNF